MLFQSYIYAGLSLRVEGYSYILIAELIKIMWRLNGEVTSDNKKDLMGDVL